MGTLGETMVRGGIVHEIGRKEGDDILQAGARPLIVEGGIAGTGPTETGAETAAIVVEIAIESPAPKELAKREKFMSKNNLFVTQFGRKREKQKFWPRGS